jgi:hypothetical protein
MKTEEVDYLSKDTFSDEATFHDPGTANRLNVEFLVLLHTTNTYNMKEILLRWMCGVNQYRMK